jgi:hypothetical protein
MDEVRILATCTLGLGFSYDGFRRGLELEPHAIACDAGSSDFGPYFLGANVLQKAALTIKRDLGLLLEGATRLGIPFLTGSVGGAGGDFHVAGTADIVRDVARDKQLGFKMATIKAEVPKAWRREKLRAGALRPVGGIGELTEERIDKMVRCVAMMGEEPFLRALDQGAQVILAGRSTDPAIFVGPALRAGMPADVAWHAAKSIDKGYLATDRPSDGSPVLARIRPDRFILEPTRGGSRCTVASVAALTLHENPDPYSVTQPTGVIDTKAAVYEQLDESRVLVTGSKYRVAAQPSLKIEGVELVGYRAILITGIRDPRILERMDDYLEKYRSLLQRAARSMSLSEDDYTLQFRVYGKDAVLGAAEPNKGVTGHEVGLIVEVVGRTQEICEAMGSRLGPTGTRLDINNNLGGGGVFAYPFSPSLIKMGPVYAWSAWHIADASEADMRQLFAIELEDVDGRAAA